MNNKRSLKDRIIRSVFVYETKKTSFETIGKISILILSLFVILVFGGVVSDIYAENGLGTVLIEFASRGEYSLMRIRELGGIYINEIPLWVFLSCLFGFMMGCILSISLIRNWSLVSRKVKSLVSFWFSL